MGLERNTRGLQELAGEIEIRQRALEDDRDGLVHDWLLALYCRHFQRTNDRQQFLLAVAPHEVRSRWCRVRGDEHRRPRSGVLDPDLVDLREEGGQALAEPGCQHRLGRHDVDLLEPGQSRQ